jgi:hypothetical protein
MTMTRRRPTGSHYLYVISNGFDHCKIGHSRAPKGRLSELQVGTHQKLRLERTWKLTIEDAKAHERTVHGLLSWARVSGEWHDMDSAEAVSVCKLVAEGRASDAEALVSLLRAMSDNEATSRRLRDEANYAPPKVRLARQREADVEAGVLALAYNAIKMQAFELGLEPSRYERYWVTRGGLAARYGPPS